ncbi:MAG: FeoA family protein [Pirellulales bacterium]
MHTNRSFLMHDLIPLSQLPVGRSGSIGAVLGLPDAVHRLEELGLREGARIEMLQSGAPCIVRLGGNKLCFRADELMTVLVTPEGTT